MPVPFIDEAQLLWPEKSTPWMSFEDLHHKLTTHSNHFVEVITKTNKETPYLSLGVKKQYGVILGFNENSAVYRIYSQAIAGGFFLIPTQIATISRHLIEQDLQKVRVASKGDLPEYEKPENLTFFEDLPR